MPRKNEFDILIAFLHISGLLIYLELKIKNNYQKTYDSTVLFGYIFINRIQPFEAANISAAFCADQWESITTVILFKISFKTIFHARLLCIHISGIHCRSLLKSIFVILRHELLEDFKNAEKRNTLVKIKLRNRKTAFRLNLWLNSSMNIKYRTWSDYK